MLTHCYDITYINSSFDFKTILLTNYTTTEATHICVYYVYVLYT